MFSQRSKRINRARATVGAIAMLFGLTVGPTAGQTSGAVDDARLLTAAHDRSNWLTFGRGYSRRTAKSVPFRRARPNLTSWRGNSR